MIDVSIVAPVYNVARYMRPSLDSFLAQTHRAIELILVDDGSSDESGKICDEYAARDDRVRVIHKENEGVGYARQTGMDAAQGEFVYFCDPDDLLDADLVADNLRLAREHDADIVVFGYETVFEDANGVRTGKPLVKLPALVGAYDFEGFWEHFREECRLEYSLCFRLFRRAYLQENNLRHPKQTTGEDALFLLQTYRTPFSAIVYNQKKPYYTYIRRGGTATSTFKPERFTNELTVSQNFDATVASRHFADNRYGDMVDRKYVMGLCMAAGNLARCGGSLSLREQARILREWAQTPEIHSALRRVSLSAFQVRSTRVKVLLLKCRLYRLAAWLGVQKNRR